MALLDIYNAILKVCPIDSVCLEEDGSHRIDFKPEATLVQQAQAFNLLSAMPLEMAKQKRKKEIDMLCYEKMGAGVLFKGEIVQTDPESLKFIGDETNAINAGVRSDGEYWRMASNNFLSLTNDEFLELAATARSYIKKCLFWSWSNKDEITALNTLEEVESYILLPME
jgi:hypothetical protein